MSLTVYLSEVREVNIFDLSVTHNLTAMAKAATIYYPLWRPEEVGIETAEQLIKPLEEGLKQLKDNPEYYKKYNPENGWGSYENFVQFVEEYLQACKDNPNAKVVASR